MGRDRKLGALALILLAGCGAFSPLATTDDDDDGMPKPPVPTDLLQRIREDFNNRDLISDQSGGVIVDVNRGIVTLEAEMFPELSANGVVTSYAQETYQNGLVEADAIIIYDGASFEASDSVELRADDRVIVAGSLVVGRGGITIIAKNVIQIDGEITSEGPVRLLLGDDGGYVSVDGTITSHSDISVYGRGAVEITGTLQTIGDPASSGGNVDVYSYGDVTVTGPLARVTTSGAPDGLAGSMTLQSESRLLIENGAQLGGYVTDPITQEFVPGGDITLKATEIDIGDDVIVAAIGTNVRAGGRIWITTTGRLSTGHRAQISAGYGPDSGSIALKGAAIELGEATRIAGGGGTTQPGIVDLQAVESLTLSPFASIEGGWGECTPGGDILIGVGGLLSIGEGAVIIGGAGNTGVNCGRGYSGGAITINAREAIGLDGAVIPGTGAEDGAVDINLIPTYSVAAPNLEVGPGGFVESRTIDRGEEIESIPRLVEIVATTPTDTSVSVFLAGADLPEGPFDEWLPITSYANSQELESLVGRRYVRYRVELDGRKFDVPILDYFEIDLAPVGF